MDFGIAKIVDTDATTTQLLAGSTAYMSPEQTLGHTLDQRTDIWSFGVVLYEMFTGKLPFTGKDNTALTRDILDGNRQPITDHPQAPHSQTLVRLIERTLQPDPQKRCARMSELFPDLQRLHSELFEATQTRPVETDCWSLPTNPSITGHQPVPTASHQHAPPTQQPYEAAPQETKETKDFLATMTQLTPHAPTNTNRQHQAQQTHRTFVLQTNDLQHIERALIEHVGPVAKFMIRRAQRRAKCVRSLCERLAKKVEAPEARTQFLAQVAPLWHEH